MLSNLNTNMKVLIGISSGDYRYNIFTDKSFFTQIKRKWLRVNDNGGNGNGNGDGNGNGGNGNGSDYRLLIKSIDSLNKHMENLNKNFINFKKMTYDHYKLFRTNMYNTLFNNNIKYTSILITHKNSVLSNGIITINDPKLLGFSVNGLNTTSIIYKSSTFHGVQNTKYIKIVILSEIYKNLYQRFYISTYIYNINSKFSSMTHRHHPHSSVSIFNLHFKLTDDVTIIIYLM